MFKSIIFLCFAGLAVSCSHDVPFESKKWKNAPVKGEEMSIRWEMSNDLLENYHLMGKDTIEIFQLLGKEGLDCYGDKCIAMYTLGPCRRGIDYGTLELTFKQGKVVDIFKHCN